MCCLGPTEGEAAAEGGQRLLQLSGGWDSWRCWTKQKSRQPPQPQRILLVIPSCESCCFPRPALRSSTPPPPDQRLRLHSRHGRHDERLRGQRLISFVQRGVTSECPACERSRGVSGTHNRARQQISLGLRELRNRFFLIQQKNNSPQSFRTEAEQPR